MEAEVGLVVDGGLAEDVEGAGGDGGFGVVGVFEEVFADVVGVGVGIYAAEGVVVVVGVVVGIVAEGGEADLSVIGYDDDGAVGGDLLAVVFALVECVSRM